jgi:uncharacterized ion transporter superfamily protein YfcC
MELLILAKKLSSTEYIQKYRFDSKAQNKALKNSKMVLSIFVIVFIGIFTSILLIGFSVYSWVYITWTLIYLTIAVVLLFKYKKTRCSYCKRKPSFFYNGTTEFAKCDSCESYFRTGIMSD